MVTAHAHGGRNGPPLLDHAVETFRADVATAAAHLSIDGQARATYDRLIRKMSAELRLRAESGAISWQAAAEEAQGVRNVVMGVIRSQSTPVGRAIAQRIKRSGRTLNELIARQTLRLFGPGSNFNDLTGPQRKRVFAAIVESAGRSEPYITRLAKGASFAGRALLFLSLAIAVCDIATAKDHWAAAKREGATLGAGILGGAAGGAVAGLACGPGAPVCVTIGAFVGGTLAAFGVSLAF